MTSSLQHDTANADAPGTTPSPAHQARMAGLLYLVVAVLGAFAQVVRVQTYVPGDATATAANVVAKAGLLRLSFVADLTQNLVWLFFAMALYRLLQHAGKNLARAVVIFVVVSVAIAMANMTNQMAAIVLATNPAYATGFGIAGANALVLLFMDLHFYGYLIAQMSWLWLFALGVLAYRSGMFPRWLGILLMVGTVSYVVHALAQFFAFSFAPGLSSAMIIPETLSEAALLLYLLIKGVKTPAAGRR
jgi:ethanolamine utilization microcompartment shell protein EutS